MAEMTMVERLVKTGRVTRNDCLAFIAAAGECGYEVVKREGPLSAGTVSPKPQPSFSHGRVTAAAPQGRRVTAVAAKPRVAALAEPGHPKGKEEGR